MTHPMRTVYWNSSRRPKTGTKKKRQARRRGPGWAAMPTAIMPMYTRDRMLVARKAAISSENMVISKPQFCNKALQPSAQNVRDSTLVPGRLLSAVITWSSPIPSSATRHCSRQLKM